MPTIENAGAPFVSGTLSATPANLSITVPGGLTNSALLVFTFHERATDTISGVTANGDACTSVMTQDPTTWSKVALYKLANPDVGTYNVAVSRSVGGTNPMRIVVYLLSSADQANIVRTPQGSNSDSASSATATVGSVVAGDLLIDQLSVDSTGHTLVPGADQTATYATVNLGAGIDEGRGSQQAGSAGGVMSWTWTTAAPFSHVAVAVIHDAGGGGGQTVSPSLVDSGPTVYSPTVSPGQVTVSPALVDAGPQVFSPTVSPGAVTVSPTLVDSGPTVFSPTVSLGGVTITPDLVDGGPQVFSPVVSPGSVTVAPGLVDAGAQVFSPAVSPGGVTISPALVDSGAAVFAPIVTRDGDAAGVSGALPLLRAG